MAKQKIIKTKEELLKAVSKAFTYKKEEQRKKDAQKAKNRAKNKAARKARRK